MPVIGFAKNLSAHPEFLPEVINDFRFAWLEGVMEAKLDYFKNVTQWREVERWPSGRIFGPSCEYCWRWSPSGGIHALLILDNYDLPKPFTGKLDLKITKDSQMILWGDWIDPETDPTANPDGGPRFYAPEIPLVQTYPVSINKALKSNSTPRLCIRRYSHMPEDNVKSKGEFARCFGILLLPDDQEGDCR